MATVSALALKVKIKRVVLAVAMGECHNCVSITLCGYMRYEGVVEVATERFQGSSSVILRMG